jgi:hypothetical protein
MVGFRYRKNQPETQSDSEFSEAGLFSAMDHARRRPGSETWAACEPTRLALRIGVDAPKMRPTHSSSGGWQPAGDDDPSGFYEVSFPFDE